MNTPVAIIKCRQVIERLKKHGITTSRRTASQAAQEGPDALLVADDGRAWLAVFWAGSTLQNQLWQEPSDTPTPDLDSTLRQLKLWRDQQELPDGFALPDLLVIAPALDREELPAGVWYFGSEAVPVITRQACTKPETLARAILNLIGPVLPKEVTDCWRALAIPETKIDSPKRRQPIVRDHRSMVAPLLLDYKQERCARLDLEPDIDARPLSLDLNVRVVTGVAGCGKTLVLVHRAALLATHFPNARVLILSHNKPLIYDLERRVRRCHAGGRIECRTFFSWLSHMAPTKGEFMKPYEVKRWVARERQTLPESSLAKFSDDWLIEEMGWMFDHDHAGDSYLKVVRKGRGIPLTARQRRELLALAQRFRTHLRDANERDWSEWPLHVSEQNLPVFEQPRFDHLLIDEAQFFAPTWLRLLTSVLKPGGHLFFCADPTQGFLRSRTSWHEIGLDVRNRSHRLEKPYRSTRAILEFARDFYQRRLPNDEEPLNLPAPEWMQNIEAGIPPIVMPGGPAQDQITRLCNELIELRSNGTPLGDVLILVAGHNVLERELVTQINLKLGSGSASSMKDRDASETSVGIAHLMAATGLERPIVFLLALDELVAEESNPTLTEEERAEKRLQHTRQIYVGLTRAMERVVIYSDRLRTAFGIETTDAMMA